MTVEGCPLCGVANGGSITPFEYLFPDRGRHDQILALDQECMAVVDVAPIGDGHCLIITREHRLSMADAVWSELASVRRLKREMGRRISRKWSGDHVFFEHGQRRESDHPDGCGIVHAHLHAVATSFDVGRRLAAVEGVEFVPCAGDMSALASVVGSSNYLYVEDRHANAWVATPEASASQVLRRQFVDPRWPHDDVRWNWSDQLVLAEAMSTRARVLANLAGLRSWESPPAPRQEEVR